LPKAHVEAPVSGSILLAGILLKIGTYGLYRSLYFINQNDIEVIINILIRIRIFGALYSALICFRQVDLKALIAYSSVCHIGFLLSAIFTLRKIRIFGALSIILGHGFCSRGLFFIVNLFYERVHTRRILLLKNISFFFYINRLF